MLSPMGSGDSGYSDQNLGGDRYAVSYVGSSRFGAVAPAQRDQDIAAARTQALDFAIWRAAQIADGGGFAGFRVVSQQASVDQSSQPVYYDQNFTSTYGGNVGAGGIVRPPSVGTTAPQSFPESPNVRLQGRASIEVQLLRTLGPNDLPAKDVIQQFRAKYPGAEGR